MAGQIKERIGWNDINNRNSNIWKCFLAEYMGNVLLNFLGCASVINVIDPAQPPNLVLIALTFGLTVFIIVQAIGHVSGGHINPAVTAGFLVTGKISLAKALVYMIAQCSGAVSGSAILKAVTPEEVQGSLGMTTIQQRLLPVQGFGMELILAFILVLVVFSVCDEHRAEANKVLGPLAIGITVVVGHLAAVDYTGSSMNPARSFGSALIAGDWNDHWIYWVAPILGGMAAALMYVNAFAADKLVPEVQKMTKGEAYTADDKELNRIDVTGSKTDVTMA